METSESECTFFSRFLKPTVSSFAPLMPRLPVSVLLSRQWRWNIRNCLVGFWKMRRELLKPIWTCAVCFQYNTKWRNVAKIYYKVVVPYWTYCGKCSVRDNIFIQFWIFTDDRWSPLRYRSRCRGAHCTSTFTPLLPVAFAPHLTCFQWKFHNLPSDQPPSHAWQRRQACRLG